MTEVSSFQRTEQSKCLSPPHMRTETDPVSETLCSLEFRAMDKSKNPVIPSAIRHRQTPSDSA
jgi:hypothetical protein